MEVICATCESIIDADNINVAKDTAYCAKCENLHHLSSLSSKKSAPKAKFDPYEKVDGVTVDDKSYMWSIDVTHRSKKALFLIPFTCVWAGGSLYSIYGQQYLSGEYDIIASIFGIPFLLGSLFLISLCLMSLFGRTHISCDNDKALYFVGVGAIGRYRRFSWCSIKKLNDSSHVYYDYDDYDDEAFHHNDIHNDVHHRGFGHRHHHGRRHRFFGRGPSAYRINRLSLIGDQEYNIGKGLNGKQRAYIAGFLRTKIK
jgi:hypothetical protein